MSWRRSDYNDRIRKECGTKPKYLSDFWAYHDMNPHVFKRYLNAAKRLEAEGRERIGISMLTEHLRYNTMLHTEDPQGLKLRNVLRAYYARLLILARPSLGAQLTLRPLAIPRRERKEPVPYLHEAGPRGRILAQLWATGLWPSEEGQ